MTQYRQRHWRKSFFWSHGHRQPCRVLICKIFSYLCISSLPLKRWCKTEVSNLDKTYICLQKHTADFSQNTIYSPACLGVTWTHTSLLAQIIFSLLALYHAAGQHVTPKIVILLWQTYCTIFVEFTITVSYLKEELQFNQLTLYWDNQRTLYDPPTWHPFYEPQLRCPLPDKTEFWTHTVGNPECNAN